MDFAEVSEVRPTTRDATACVWGEDAGPLLEWLGIGRESWIKRDSVLEAHIGDLRGLILVDLPDYDSAVDAHHEIADRLLPLADVLVWVTDPQKYADPALHERFAAAAKTHQGRVALVVLNQIDTVSREDARRIEDALTALLVEDGAADPVVALTSTKTGQGVDGVRAELMSHVAPRTAAVRRLAGDLDAAAGQFVEQTDLADAPAGPEWMAAAAAAAVDSLIAACAPAPTVEAPPTPDADQARQACAAWTAEVASHLPEQWGVALTCALATPANIATRLSEALAPLQVPPVPGLMARLFRRSKAIRERRAEWERRLRGALQPVVDRTMVQPTVSLLGDRAELWRLAGRVREAAAAIRSPR
jgi:hypothetical protein